MLAETLRTLYGYNRWATERVLAAADRLTSEQLDVPGGAGRGSVRETLIHLISTQRGWLSWWDGSLSADEAYQFRLDPADLPDVAAVRTAWEAVEQQTESFIAGLDDAGAARIYETTLPNGAEWRVPLWQMMLHVANHGTQHRSEAAILLTGLGRSPGDLDFLYFAWKPADSAAG